MSDQPPRVPASLWEQISAVAQRVVVIVAALGVLWAVLIFLTGGVRPQSQIDLDSLKDQVSRVQSGLAVCSSRLDAMPRSSDYADWQAHLSRLDAVYEALRDRMTAAEYAIKENTAETQNLLSGSKTPVRNPR